jgi:hypothetical protein
MNNAERKMEKAIRKFVQAKEKYYDGVPGVSKKKVQRLHEIVKRTIEIVNQLELENK